MRSSSSSLMSMTAAGSRFIAFIAFFLKIESAILKDCKKIEERFEFRNLS